MIILKNQDPHLATYYISAGPKPVSNVIVAVDKTFVLKEATPINIVLPRFNEEDGIIR